MLADPVPSKKVSITDIFVALRMIVQLLTHPKFVNETVQRVRMDLEAISGSTTLVLPTVTTLTNLTYLGGSAGIGGFPPKDTLLHHSNRQDWQLSVRSRIGDGGGILTN